MATPDDKRQDSEEAQQILSDGQRNAGSEELTPAANATATTIDDKPEPSDQQPKIATERHADNKDHDSDDSDTDSSSSDAEEGRETQAHPAPAIEWLATGREKRSTAGNRLKHMLAAQEPDDELELLFAEDGDDAAFSEADDDGSDLHMDSSSDDEDGQHQGDDLEGERELEKKARENRQAARKRKAQEAIPLKFRKKVKIAAPARSGSLTSSSAATPTTAGFGPGARPAHVPRPKRKSERASWLPTAADMPTRASRRETTMMSKEQLHQQMIEREVKRIKQVEAMERKAKKMEALRKPPKTQAERLAEAAIIEKKNAKSLNRWEEAEKQREEERRAKLAALNNRTLDGPVVTFWSGVGEWVDGKLKYVGKIVTIEEKPLKKKRGLAADGDGAVEGVADDVPMSEVATTKPGEQAAPGELAANDENQVGPSTVTTGEAPAPVSAVQPPTDQSQTSPTNQDTKTANAAAPDIETPSDAATIKEMPTAQVTASSTVPPAPVDIREPSISTEEVPNANVLDSAPGEHSQVDTSEAQPPSTTSAPTTTSESISAGPSHPTTTSGEAVSGAIQPPSTTTEIDTSSSTGTEQQEPLSTSGAPSQEPTKANTAVTAQDVEMADVMLTADTVSITPGSVPQPQPQSSVPLDPQPQLPSPQPPALGPGIYTTMAFAPPPQLAMIMPQNGDPSASNILAHPMGVGSGGLSIPQIGHASAPNIPLSGQPLPEMSAAPGLQAQSAPPGMVIPQCQQPHVRAVLSDVPVNVQSQAMPGQQYPQLPVLPAKPRGGRQKKEKEKETSPPPPPRTPPPDGKATRNCFILQNFNENAIKEKSVQTKILFGKEMNKLAKPAPPPRCVITGQPARYKDPKTGLPYYNSFAYKEIQKLQKGEYKFSSLLGTWMGSGSTAATGVPARFLDPSAPGPPPPPPVPTPDAVEQPPPVQSGGDNGEGGIAAHVIPADKVPDSAPGLITTPATQKQPQAIAAPAPTATPAPPAAATMIPNQRAGSSAASGPALPGTTEANSQAQPHQGQPEPLAEGSKINQVASQGAAQPEVAMAHAPSHEAPVAQP